MEATIQTNGNAKHSNSSGKKDIIIDRVLELPINKVWQAWTQSELCKKWWGPKDFTSPVCSLDFRMGGKYLNCMRSPEGKEFWSTGVYKEIIPYKKLVFTDSFSDKKGNVIPAAEMDMPGDWPLEMLVTVSFEQTGEKTRMKLKHEGIPAEMHDECTKGWNESFDKLEENINTRHGNNQSR